MRSALASTLEFTNIFTQSLWVMSAPGAAKICRHPSVETMIEFVNMLAITIKRPRKDDELIFTCLILMTFSIPKLPHGDNWSPE